MQEDGVKGLKTDKIITNKGKIDRYANRRFMQTNRSLVSPKTVGAIGSYSSQPRDLISIKEFEERKVVSHEFWRFMRGCGEAWKKICHDFSIYPLEDFHVFPNHIPKLKVQQASPGSESQQGVPSKPTTYTKATTTCKRKGKDKQG